MSSQMPIPARPAEDVSQEGAYDSLVPPRVFAGASIPQVIFSFAAMLGTCLVARVFYALRKFAVDPDVWWHIKYGQGILATHHWPTIEQFSFTAAGRPWLSYEWVGDVLLAAVYQVGGLRGLGVLLIVLGSLFALALYYCTTLRCGNPKAGFLATALIFNLANFCNLRPQMLGYLFLIFTLIILERFRQGKRGAIWLLPSLTLVWVNTHGSWIIGLGTVGVYMACGLANFHLGSVKSSKWSASDRGKLVAVFALSALATVITPYGTRLATYPFLVASKVPLSITNVQEWMPMAFTLAGNKLFLILVLGFLLVQALLRPKWRLEELGLFLLAAIMSFMHMRFLALFVAFSAPIFVVILVRWIPKYDRSKEVFALNAAIILGIAAAMVWYFPSRSDYARIVEKSFPVAAVDYLNTHPVPGPMYNDYYFGGYLILARGPEHKVFIDGRAEIYESAGVLSDQIALLNLDPGSLTVLQKYDIQSCLLSPYESLATVLAALPEWQKVYADDTSVVFVRRQSAAQQEEIRAVHGDPARVGRT
jgi:hypothetical protein